MTTPIDRPAVEAKIKRLRTDSIRDFQAAEMLGNLLFALEAQQAMIEALRAQVALRDRLLDWFKMRS